MDRDPLELLDSVHYKFFMASPRFWYENDLQQADMIIVVAMSDLRNPGSPPFLPSLLKAQTAPWSANRLKSRERTTKVLQD